MTTTKATRCPICQTEASDTLDTRGNTHAIMCPRCGSFRIARSWADRLRDGTQLSTAQAANAAGYLRENPHFLIESESDVGFLRRLRKPSVTERAMKLLSYCAKRFPEIGSVLHLKDFVMYGEGTSYSHDAGTNPSKWDAAALLGCTWATTVKEVHYLISSVLIETLQFIAADRISPSGWLALNEAGTQMDESLAFVAMWFDETLKTTYTEAIEPAIRAAGYKSERMDFVEHTDPIDDKMMADIRRAKFLVADLTAHRQNVYFEAGFALGLGKQVIWLIREDAKDDKSFDIRQYNFIYWKHDDLPALKERLTNRILGSSNLGEGPLRG